jgi:phosphatidylserine/phosphatidylglycerophosphate/cardiolipin synthase-like enzyme
MKKSIIIFLFFLTSCASMMVGFTPYPGAPSNLTATEKVEVLSAMPTDKQYIQLGEIKSEGFSDEKVIDRIVKKAKEVGADAVVIINREDKGKDLPGFRVWRAVAIKYK